MTTTVDSKVKPEPKVEEAPKQANNIVFIADYKEAPANVRIDNHKIKLPDTKMQKKGFYIKDAQLVISTFPHLYKEVKKLGE